MRFNNLSGRLSQAARYCGHSYELVILYTLKNRDESEDVKAAVRLYSRLPA